MSSSTCPLNESAHEMSSPAARHLLVVELLAAKYPENDKMRRLARRLVLDKACAIQAHEAADEDDLQNRDYLFDRLDSAGEHLAVTQALVEALSDVDLSLVLQGLLEIHLRMTLQWLATVKDPVLLQRAASPDHLYTRAHSRTLTRPDLLARQLVVARQGAGLDGGMAITYGQIEGELRRQWRESDRPARFRVVEHVAYLAACVAVDRCNHAPWGIFEFLED